MFYNIAAEEETASKAGLDTKLPHNHRTWVLGVTSRASQLRLATTLWQRLFQLLHCNILYPFDIAAQHVWLLYVLSYMTSNS